MGMPEKLASAAVGRYIDSLVLQCLPRSSCMLVEDSDGDVLIYLCTNCQALFLLQGKSFTLKRNHCFETCDSWAGKAAENKNKNYSMLIVLFYLVNYISLWFD